MNRPSDPLAARLLLPLAAVSMLAAAPAMAQPEFCARPERPGIPAGGSAAFEALSGAREAVDDYLDRMQDYLDCLQDESRAAALETDAVVDEWNAAVAAFEARHAEDGQ